MNKHLLVTGLVIILLIVGLSGCVENENTITVDELIDNKLKYNNKEVYIKGYLDKFEGLSETFESFYIEYKLYEVSGKRYIKLDKLYLNPDIQSVDDFKPYGGTSDNDYVIVNGKCTIGEYTGNIFIDVYSVEKI